MIALAIIGWLIVVVVVVAFVRGGTRKPTPRLPIPDYETRYKGGDELCDVCGEPSFYYLGKRCVHPDCWRLTEVMTP